MSDDTSPPDPPIQLSLNGFDAPEDVSSQSADSPSPRPSKGPDTLLAKVINSPPEALSALAAQARALELDKALAERLLALAPPRASRGLLGRLLKRGYTSSQRANALRMIRLLHHPVDVEPIIAAIYDRRHTQVQVEATRTLGEIGLWIDWEKPLMAQIVHVLTIAARHQTPEVRIAAAKSLGRLPVSEAEAVLMQRLEAEKSTRVRDVVAMALGSLKSADAVRALIESYENGEIAFDVAVEALAQLGKAANDPLISTMRRWNVRSLSRQLAAQALGKIGSEEALGPLLEIVRRPHEPEDMRIAAVRALGSMGTLNASPILWGVYREPTIGDDLRKAIKETIDHLREEADKEK